MPNELSTTEEHPSLEKITLVFDRNPWRQQKWCWQAEIRLSGEIEGYTNSYSGKSWFLNNALQLDEAIEGAIEKAIATIQKHAKS